MSIPADMAERHAAILGELSQLGLALARDVQARALAADDDAAACDLGLAFHRISRSVRQSLALEARLAREHAQAGREAAEQAARAALGAAQRKRAQVRHAISRLIWDEAEGEEAEALIEELEERLFEEAHNEAFTADPVETCIARIRDDLGLSAEPDPIESACGGRLPLAHNDLPQPADWDPADEDASARDLSEPGPAWARPPSMRRSSG